MALMRAAIDYKRITLKFLNLDIFKWINRILHIQVKTYTKNDNNWLLLK